MKINELLDLLPSKENFECGLPATEADLGRIEGELRVVLPESYKEFLRRFGYAAWFGHSVFGVHHPPPGDRMVFDCDVVRRTLAARAERLPVDFKPLPSDGVVIEQYDAGGYYMLYSATAGATGVALFDHEQLGEVSQSWPSFEDFLVSLARLR